MLIVIEGVDRTGKTTLANRLAEEINGRVIHAGPPTRHPIEEYVTSLDDYTPSVVNSTILDRWHVGEHVWPIIFERETKFQTAAKRHTEMFMRSRGALMIYAHRDYMHLKDELVANNEPLHPDDVHRTQLLFQEAIKNYSDGYLVWNYGKSSHNIEGLISAALGRQRLIEPIWQVIGPGWIGNPTPLYLLVGDELGPEKEGRNPPNDVPFAPYEDTSGHYLMNCLTSWQQAAIVNSLQGRDQKPRNLKAVWKAFNCPRVVALGARARSALNKYGVPHVDVPHPQYWRRFRYHEPEEYTRRIEEAAFGI